MAFLRKYRRWFWGAFIIYCAIAGGLLAVAYGAVRNAQRNLPDARAELNLVDVENIESPNLEQTANSMRQAHQALSNPIMAPVKLLPVLGRQLRAIDALSGSGHKALTVAVDALDRSRTFALNPPRTGPERVDAAKQIGDIARESRAKLTNLNLGPKNNLIGPIADARSKFVTEINHVGDLLTKADFGGKALELFLKGPSHYLLVASNNAEMRAGGGMYLSAGLLDVQNGNITLSEMKSIDAYPQAPVTTPLDPDYKALWGTQAPGAGTKFVNMTPRFPSSSALLQRMWAASGQPPVDGVVAVDPVFTTALLNVTGPEKVGTVEINYANALKIFMHDQYVAFRDDAGQTTNRRELLGDITKAVFNKINAGNIRPTKLGSAFGAAAAGRHVMAWTNDATIQQGWAAIGMDGQLPDLSLMFSLQNRGGNKLDYFQKVLAKAKVEVSKAGTDFTVDFDITNTVPNGEVPYISGGPGRGAAVKDDVPNIYGGIVSINLPKVATNVTLTGGWIQATKARPDGNTQSLWQWTQVKQGETTKVQLKFRLPPGYNALKILPSARIPGVEWRTDVANWTDTSARVVTW